VDNSERWYKTAVVYSLSVGTYLDSNGDGIGDFTGLMRRLDYLQGPGVTTIWLMPFQPSPRKDDGYDIADYYGVDPSYGTLGDFVEFTAGCRQRGIRLLIDLVVNHTSDQHPWFVAARKDPHSPYRDWYVWADKEPANARDGIVFPGVQKSTWTYDKVAKAWYFHRFYDFQPDLNTSNPLVQAEILKVMGFWIQLGVSGFRMDAVPFVIVRPKARPSPNPLSSTICCASFASSCSGVTAKRSSWPRPTCCRRPTCTTSATPANGCRCYSTSR
jgi:maltose alpha-D-glucosyltransferase/alpha-amylase